MMKRHVVAASLLLALVVAASTFAPPASAAVAPRTVAPSETFNVGMLRVEHFGAARRTPLIFIPALYCGSWQWNREIAGLAKNYDIYAVTLPGFDGRAPDRGSRLMERATASLADLIRTRNLDRPIVVGHSLGGTLTVLFAETHPAQTRGIVAVEGGYPIAPTAAARNKSALAASRPYFGVSPATFARVLRANQLQYVITDKRDVATVATYADRSDPTSVARWMRAALVLDLTPALVRIRVPFTEIVPYSPTIDPYTGFPTLDSKRRAYTVWLAHAGDGRLVTIAPSRHFVMFDRPQAFDAALFAAIAYAAP